MYNYLRANRANRRIMARRSDRRLATDGCVDCCSEAPSENVRAYIKCCKPERQEFIVYIPERVFNNSCADGWQTIKIGNECYERYGTSYTVRDVIERGLTLLPNPTWRCAVRTGDEPSSISDCETADCGGPCCPNCCFHYFIDKNCSSRFNQDAGYYTPTPDLTLPEYGRLTCCNWGSEYTRKYYENVRTTERNWALWQCGSPNGVLCYRVPERVYNHTYLNEGTVYGKRCRGVQIDSHCWGVDRVYEAEDYRLFEYVPTGGPCPGYVVNETSGGRQIRNEVVTTPQNQPRWCGDISPIGLTYVGVDEFGNYSCNGTSTYGSTANLERTRTWQAEVPNCGGSSIRETLTERTYLDTDCLGRILIHERIVTTVKYWRLTGTRFGDYCKKTLCDTYRRTGNFCEDRTIPNPTRRVDKTTALDLLE